jgi:hypothetical protein
MMRALAAVFLAGCSFQHGAGLGTDATGGDDGPRAIDAHVDAADASSLIPPDAAADGPTHAADWWNPAWGYRMKLTVTNGAATAMATGYQVGLALDLDLAPCTGSRNAVRIVYGTTEIPRVIDEVGTVEWTWFPLQAPVAVAGATSAYWLYCGNGAAAAAPSDPATVFDFYDDFPGTSLGAAWTAQGAVTVAASQVTIGNGNSGIHSNATFGANTAIDFIASATANAVSNPYWWAGYQANFSTTVPWVIWHARNGASQIHPSVFETGGTAWDGTSVALDTSPHLYGVEHYGDSAAFRQADAIVQTRTYGASMAATSFNLRLHNYSSGGSVSFDMARVRKAVNPAPAVAVGAVETY